MSWRRRNTDWQAWGQHRRRGTTYAVRRSRAQEIEAYQAQFEQQEDGRGRLKTEKEDKK